MKNLMPYIGITGLTNEKEVEQVASLSQKSTTFSSHKLMLGFLVSYKTLNGIPVENKRYPQFREISNLLQLVYTKDFFTTIHYNSREQGLFNQINNVFGEGIYSDNLCRGLQINIPWPDKKELKKIKFSFPEIKIIFQTSKTVLDSGNIKEVTSRISSYSSLLDYVLIDPSGGNSIRFDEIFSCDFYEELSKKMSWAKIGFAGGLNGENAFSRIKSLENRLGRLDFCIDAEGGLRDKFSNKYGDDCLNLEKVSKYIIESSKAFTKLT